MITITEQKRAHYDDSRWTGVGIDVTVYNIEYVITLIAKWQYGNHISL